MFCGLLGLWFLRPALALSLSSANIPLNSPIYLYLEKLAGLGLITSDIKGLLPFTKAETARLAYEAREKLSADPADNSFFANELLRRIEDLIPREMDIRNDSSQTPLLDANPAAWLRLRYVYLDGVPRSYNRDVRDAGNQSAFGFIGGNLRPNTEAILHQSGSEGTPLLENNEGVIFPKGQNVELRWAMEGYLKDKVTLLLEPSFLATPDSNKLYLQKAYVKLGGGGLELEVGRDANWFGPGFRGTTTLTNNARNFDLAKLSSPEPLDVAWIKRFLGDVKYSFIVSRFDETGSDGTLRQPYFIGLKLAVKPKTWFEYGINFVRQEGGPGFTGSSTLQDQLFGGGTTNHNNTIAGLDLRFRIPWLRNAELYGEYSGEDSAGFWPFVESYVGGIFIPCLTADGRNDLRFEYFWGSPILYTDFKFPAGYVYHGMTPGHSQGGAAQDFFVRYSHWCSPRNTLALEYSHTNRGKLGKMPGQVTEYKNAGRISWRLPLHGDLDAELLYGFEQIDNLNLVAGADRHNQLFKVDISYRY